VASFGRGRHRVRSTFRKRATAADRAVGTGCATDRKLVLLRVDDERRNAGGVSLAVGRVVEVDVIRVGAWPKVPRARIKFTVNVMVFADVVTVPDVDEAVSQLGVVIEYFTLPVATLSVYLKDDGEYGPPCAPEAVAPVAGVTCSAGGLTVSVAVRVWVPWPLSVFVKVIVVGP
jgi:hypothetical protein